MRVFGNVAAGWLCGILRLLLLAESVGAVESETKRIFGNSILHAVLCNVLFPALLLHLFVVFVVHIALQKISGKAHDFSRGSISTYSD